MTNILAAHARWSAERLRMIDNARAWVYTARGQHTERQIAEHQRTMTILPARYLAVISFLRDSLRMPFRVTHLDGDTAYIVYADKDTAWRVPVGR